MRLENEMKLEFKSMSCNESFARAVAAAFFSQLDPTVDEITDVKTAVSEAVTNAIIHGYDQEEEGMIILYCKIKDHAMEISITDFGKGIEDIELAKEPLYTSKPDMERSGMGFAVMESFMDRIEVKSQMGIGTTVCMYKSLLRN